MNELLTMLAMLAKMAVLLVTILYVTADIIVSKKLKAEIAILLVIGIFFISLEHLLSSYTNLVSSTFVATLAIYLSFFRREVLRTLREAIGTLNYLKEILRYKLGT